MNDAVKLIKVVKKAVSADPYKINTTMEKDADDDDLDKWKKKHFEQQHPEYDDGYEEGQFVYNMRFENNEKVRLAICYCQLCQCNALRANLLKINPDGYIDDAYIDFVADYFDYLTKHDAMYGLSI